MVQFWEWHESRSLSVYTCWKRGLTDVLGFFRRLSYRLVLVVFRLGSFFRFLSLIRRLWISSKSCVYRVPGSASDPVSDPVVSNPRGAFSCRSACGRSLAEVRVGDSQNAGCDELASKGGPSNYSTKSKAHDENTEHSPAFLVLLTLFALLPCGFRSPEPLESPEPPEPSPDRFGSPDSLPDPEITVSSSSDGGATVAGPFFPLFPLFDLATLAVFAFCNCIKLALSPKKKQLAVAIPTRPCVATPWVAVQSIPSKGVRVDSRRFILGQSNTKCMRSCEQTCTRGPSLHSSTIEIKVDGI
jgi:hypothetical protein